MNLKLKLASSLVLGVLFFSNFTLAAAQSCEGGHCRLAGQRCGNDYYEVVDNSCSAQGGFACCPIDETGQIPSPEEIEKDDGFQVVDGPSNATFDELNPLKQYGNDISETLTTPGAIVSRLLDFLLPAAGLILFVMLVWGGFEMLVGSAGKASMDAGRQRVTAAVVGFILLFIAYWIFQIIEIIFGVAIL